MVQAATASLASASTPTGSTPSITARDVVHRYGNRRALNHFSIDVPAGSVFGLLGPNGSGKSTFISLLAGMELPTEGTLSVFGQEPAPGLRARVGAVFQENAQDPLMTVAEHLELAGRLFGMGRAAIRSRAPSLLATFGLAARAADPVSKLSGGMRRRLELARALLHNPELLILDEPTTGIDAGEREALWAALLGPERGARTILLATNDLSEADAVCEQVAFLKDGAVITTGTPAELRAGLLREAVRVEWVGVSAEALREVRAWPGTGAVTLDGDTVHVTVDDAAAFVPRLFALAPGAIRSVRVERATLQDAYFQFVGRRSGSGEAAK